MEDREADMRVKVLVLDIDGTLTNSGKEIAPATKACILDALERGHKCVLASGRPAHGCGRYVRELELERYGGYLLSHNGARSVAYGTGETIYEKNCPWPPCPACTPLRRRMAAGWPPIRRTR